MREIEDKLIKNGVMPIICLDRVEDAAALGKALVEGGIELCEVVFHSENALDVLRTLCEECPQLIVGAGTVLTRKQVEQAKEAGAKFIVSPGLDTELVDDCHEMGLVAIPGIATASELQMAIKHGVNIAKFFPAGLQGGVKAITAFAAPFPDVKFVPTNGVGMDNLEEYAVHPSVAACGGIYPCPSDLIEAGKWDEITKRCREALARVRAARDSAGI